MRKLKWIFIVLIAALGFNACSSSDLVFEEKKGFDEQKWMRFEVDTFRVNIKNIEDCYDIFFQCRYTPYIDTNISTIPMMVKMVAPSGQMRSFLYNVTIRNKNGNFEGDKLGAIYDNDSRMREHFFFNESGEHIITTQQVTSHYEIFEVMGIGLKVVKSKLDYSFPE